MAGRGKVVGVAFVALVSQFVIVQLAYSTGSRHAKADLAEAAIAARRRLGGASDSPFNQKKRKEEGDPWPRGNGPAPQQGVGLGNSRAAALLRVPSGTQERRRYFSRVSDRHELEGNWTLLSSQAISP